MNRCGRFAACVSSQQRPGARLLLDRRQILLAGAAVCAGCGDTPARAQAPDAAADAEFRRAIER
ncbi:MAG: hypothetical protein ACREDO_06245, partial [Methyloceanibacter sp.]